jgi:hypothetical protein
MGEKNFHGCFSVMNPTNRMSFPKSQLMHFHKYQDGPSDYIEDVHSGTLHTQPFIFTLSFL